MNKKRSNCSFLMALIFLGLVGFGSSGQNGAAPNAITTSAQTLATDVVAKIIPPQPYSVYVGQAYALTVGVQYSVIPSDMTVFLYIVSESYTSQFAPVSRSGTASISLQLQAPPSPGVYRLQLNLFVRIPGQEARLWDSATVTYQAVRPAVTDWDVQKAWIKPESPGIGDEVTFHATIELRSTTSTEPLNVVVACYLDRALYYVGSMTFQPRPYTQDLEVPKAWKAVQGTHSVTFVVDPEGRHNDPTPYPSFNFKEVRFAVEAYYAIIKNISAPQEVGQGKEFDVVITVEYKLPPNTNLKINHINIGADPPANQQKVDTVSGSGSRDYIFKAKAPSTGACYASALAGNGTVMFDTGKGWETTSPGAWGYYSLDVKPAEYYAKLGSIKAAHPPSANQSGLILITIQVEYYLPKETGLRVTVSRSLASGNITQVTIWKDEVSFTQEPAERVMLYEFPYNFACSDCSGSSTSLIFHATLDYLACGGWQNGGEETTQITVPNPPRLTKTPADYLIAALQRILDWFRKILGL